MQWRIELLGGLRLVALGGCGATTPITRFESQKTGALLAILSLHAERALPREELCAYLWPDAEFSIGRNRLKQALSSLRRMMEPPGIPAGSVLTADRFALRLRSESFESDVRAFDKAVRAGQWQQARELWRGELLPGFYEEPILLERERLNALYAQVQRTATRLPAEACAVSGATPAPAPHSPVRHQLPVPPTPFFGREEELSIIAALLAGKRWVTLTGPGGMGKTRLALEAARRFPGEATVRFVGLATTQEVSHIPEAIARTLALPSLATGDDLWEQLAGRLANRPLLLVLDNAEHLVTPQSAKLFRRFSERLPQARLLITSRLPFDSTAETVLPVRPMPIPSADATPETLAQNPVLQLFLDRARRVRADMQITPRNAVTLKAICRHLEGIPLAVELCAASAHALAPVQILDRLHTDSHVLLVSHRRDTMERHRSLEGALASTCSLLSPAQQHLLGDLTVFRGGCTVEMVEAICPTEQILADLSALTEASLLQIQSRDEVVSFTMLETIRQFAARLRQTEEGTIEVEERHADFFQKEARAFAANRETDEIAALEGIDRILDNLRVAVSRALVRQEYEAVLSLVICLDGYWQIRGYGSEVLGWLETALNAEINSSGGSRSLRTAALALCGSLYLGQGGYCRADTLLQEALREATHSGETALQAQALYHLGRLAYLRGDLEESRKQHEAALALRRSSSDPVTIARSCHVLGQIAQKGKDWNGACAWYQEAMAMARRTMSGSLIADILYDTAFLAKDMGHLDQAAAILQECAETAQHLHILRLQAKVWNNLGDLHQLRGDPEQAGVAFRQSAHLFCQLRDGPALHFPLWNLACQAYEAKAYEKSLSLFACAVRLWEEVGRPIDEESAALLQTVRTQVRRVSGPVMEGFWWARGYALRFEEVLFWVEHSNPV